MKIKHSASLPLKYGTTLNDLIAGVDVEIPGNAKVSVSEYIQGSGEYSDRGHQIDFSWETGE